MGRFVGRAHTPHLRRVAPGAAPRDEPSRTPPRPDGHPVHRRAGGDRAVEWRCAGDFTGSPFQGIEPTGKRVEIRGLDLFEIQEEQILSSTSYYDGADFARQVGMLPPRDSGPDRAIRNAFNAVTRIRRVVNERTGS